MPTSASQGETSARLSLFQRFFLLFVAFAATAVFIFSNILTTPTKIGRHSSAEHILQPSVATSPESSRPTQAQRPPQEILGSSVPRQTPTRLDGPNESETRTGSGQPAKPPFTAQAVLNPLPQQTRNTSDAETTTPVEHPNVAIPLPPSLEELYPRTSLQPSEDALRRIPCTSPLVIATYSRPSLNHAGFDDIFFFTAALTLRNISARFCVLRGRLLPVETQFNDAIACHAPRAIHTCAHVDARIGRNYSVVVRVTDPSALPLSEKVLYPVQSGDLTRLPPPYSPDLHYLRSFSASPPPRDHFGLSPSRASELTRYAVCHVLLVAPSAENAVEWVAHHRRLGVDHVYIFDNGAKFDLRAAFARRQDVEVIAWPWKHSQVQAYALVMVAARRRCRHVFISDLDEWLMPGLGATPFRAGRRPLHEEIARAEHAGQPHVQFVVFQMINSGYVRKPSGHWPELYLHMRKKTIMRPGKSVCSSDWDWRGGVVHECGIVKGGRRPGRYMADIPRLRDEPGGGFFPNDTDSAAMLVHYYVRSWEEWVEKLDLGGMSVLGYKFLARDRGKFTVEQPPPSWMKAHKDDSVMEYTHFRNVWRRVREAASGRVNEIVLVRAARNGSIVREFHNIAALNSELN